MKVLMIDDIPSSKSVSLVPTRTALTFDEGISALNEGGWDVVYLDHDLGDEDPKKTGYALMCYLEENTHLMPKEIIFTSRNPVGLKNMKAVYSKLGK